MTSTHHIGNVPSTDVQRVVFLVPGCNRHCGFVTSGNNRDKHSPACFWIVLYDLRLWKIEHTLGDGGADIQLHPMPTCPTLSLTKHVHPSHQTEYTEYN